MTRSRQCQGQGSEVGQNFTAPCDGNEKETKPCRIKDCPVRDPCDRGMWSSWSPCGDDGGFQYRHRVIPDRTSPSKNPGLPSGAGGVICPKHVEMRQCVVKVGVKLDVLHDNAVDHDLTVGAPATSDTPSVAASHQEEVRRMGVIYLVIVGLISFILGGVACVGLFLYIQHHRRQQREEEAMWSTNLPFSNNLGAVPKLNNLTASQDSLEMRMMNNLNEMSEYNVFGSLRKGKVTVSEASTLQRNSMWTNLSINDL